MVASDPLAAPAESLSKVLQNEPCSLNTKKGATAWHLEGESSIKRHPAYRELSSTTAPRVFARLIDAATEGVQQSD